jgi:hypothetical protein
MLPSSHRVTGGGHPPSVGERRINAAEAEIVRRIFREFAAGRSPRAVALALNREVSPDRLVAPGATPPYAATRPSRTVASAPQQVEHSQQVVG